MYELYEKPMDVAIILVVVALMIIIMLLFLYLIVRELNKEDGK